MPKIRGRAVAKDDDHGIGSGDPAQEGDETFRHAEVKIEATLSVGSI